MQVKEFKAGAMGFKHPATDTCTTTAPYNRMCVASVGDTEALPVPLQCAGQPTTKGSVCCHNMWDDIFATNNEFNTVAW
jgi:hypothetical protein